MPTGICLMGTDDHKRSNSHLSWSKNIVVVLSKIRKKAGGICTDATQLHWSHGGSVGPFTQRQM